MTEEAEATMYQEMTQIGIRILDEWKYNGQVNYGDAFLELGAKGQFSDIWRKIKKLKRAVWEEKPLVGEQAEQIAAEIIPHCLMLIYCLQQKEKLKHPIGIAVNEVEEGELVTVVSLPPNCHPEFAARVKYTLDRLNDDGAIVRAVRS